MATIDSNNCIPSGLRADIMRQSMENKNLLSKKGSIYVGTGESITVEGEKIYKTKALGPGSTQSGVLAANWSDLTLFEALQSSNFSSETIYSNFKNTWEHFVATADLFDEEIAYSNLKLVNDNISDTKTYPSIIFIDEKTSSTSLGDWGKLSLIHNPSTKQISLSPNITKGLYLIKVSVSGSVIGATLYFFFYSNATEPEEVNSIAKLKAFLPSGAKSYLCPQGGEPDSESGDDLIKLARMMRSRFEIVYSSGSYVLKWVDANSGKEYSYGDAYVYVESSAISMF